MENTRHALPQYAATDPPWLLAAPAHTHITNTATRVWQAPDGPAIVTSNTVTFDVQPRARHPAALGFRLLPNGNGEPHFTPGPTNTADLARAPVAEKLDFDLATIVVLEAPGGNHEAMRGETAWIRVDICRFDFGQQVGVGRVRPDGQRPAPPDPRRPR